MKFGRKKNLNAIWVLALFLNVFPAIVFAAAQEVPWGMVYSPLKKQMQPVKARKTRLSPFYDFCARDERKREFTAGFLTSGHARTGHIEREGSEKLVFELFDKGSEVFLGLPLTPELPHRRTVKTLRTSLPAGNSDGSRTGPATPRGECSLAQNPRSLAVDNHVSFGSDKRLISQKLARRIASRAPPFSVSFNPKL